jgi:Icc-related predicted phosphoesterase
MDQHSRGLHRPALTDLADHADVMLLAGDLTRHGTPAEAAVVRDEFADIGVPVVAVLGNHDYHCEAEQEVVKVLGEAGIQVLDGDTAVVDIGEHRLGVAGLKGFGGGFAGRCCSVFGEPEMKAFAKVSHDAADRLRAALRMLCEEGADRRVALLHYAPVPDTLRGEPLEIYPFLGSYLLAEAVDQAGADLVVHGHAHAGIERGTTPGRVPVRNVAQPVIRRAYAVYRLG